METLDNGSQEVSLCQGRFINARRYAIRDEIKQEILFALGGIFQQLRELCALGCIDGLWHHPHG